MVHLIGKIADEKRGKLFRDIDAKTQQTLKTLGGHADWPNS